jgi:hypothetical protein
MFEDGFGNARVTGLREISLPEPVSMMPATMGWWVLAGLVIAWLAWFVYCRYRRWQRNRYRAVALGELARIERQWSLGDPEGLIRIPALLKRTAMHAFGREGVADLTGPEWLGFLDRTLGNTNFTQGPGQLLVSLAYKKTETILETEFSGMLAAVREWISSHKENVERRM